MAKSENFMNWDNPGIALITGASAGIGVEFARQLAAQGFDTVLVARREKRLKELATELQEKYSIKVEVLVADLAKQTDINSVVGRIMELDKLDVLINNAGFGTRGYFENAPLEPQIDMISVHVLAPVYFCRAALPKMIQRDRGVIINVSSMAIDILVPQNVMYCATKAFEKIFTETLALELEGTGVRVQALCPGFTHTDFHFTETFKEFDKSSVPKDMWMTTEEVVKLSLKAFQDDKVVFIPGAINENVLNMLNDPKIGPQIRKVMIESSRIPR